MDKNTLSSIMNLVYKNYPDFQGIQPSVQPQENNSAIKTPSKLFILIFKTKVNSSNDKSIQKYLRITVDEQGKILKTSISH